MAEHDTLDSYLNHSFRKLTVYKSNGDLHEQQKSFEIGVNAEWLKEQKHQIKYERVLFLQGKIVEKIIDSTTEKKQQQPTKFH